MAAVYPHPTPMHAFPTDMTFVQTSNAPYVVQATFPYMPAMPNYHQAPCFYWGYGSTAPVDHHVQQTAIGVPSLGVTSWASGKDMRDLALDSSLGVTSWASSKDMVPDSSSGATSWASGKDLMDMRVEEPMQEEATTRRPSRKSKKASRATIPRGLLAMAGSRDPDAGASSETDSETSSFRAKWGEPTSLCEDEQIAAEVMDFLSTCDAQEQHAMVSWLSGAIRPLALSKQGTRVVQWLLEFSNKAEKDRITDALKPHIRELYESAHGNHTLAKVVEQLPSATVQFIVRELLGSARDVSRHQYGCRIMERLIEHCPDEGDMSALLDEIVHDAEQLCRHNFANFVVQHLLEHGSYERRASILRQVDYKLPELAMHRTASHFVQQLLNYSDQESLRVIVNKLLHSEGPEVLQQVAGSRYGSFVIEQLANLADCYDEAREALQQVMPSFTAAQLKFARKVIVRFQLHPFEAK